MSEINRGDIFMGTLNDGKGSEQHGHRPLLVIQNNIGNRFSGTVIVASVTSKPKKKMPTHVEFNLDETICTVMLEQIHTISKERLKEKIGHLDNQDMKEIDRAMVVSLGICISL